MGSGMSALAAPAKSLDTRVRLTVDMEVGSYARFAAHVKHLNAAAPASAPHAFMTGVMRSLMGSWMLHRERVHRLPSGWHKTQTRNGR